MGQVVALDRMLSRRQIWSPGSAPAHGADDGEPSGHAGLDALLPQRGWPRRSLCEVLLPEDGCGEVDLLAPLLARMSGERRTVALVGAPWVAYAPAWQALGVDLRWLVLVQARGRDALWAFEQCLRSAACAVVVGWPEDADTRALRRLQVAADSGECLGFAIRHRRHALNPSPAPLRIERTHAGWQVRKCRGAPVPAQAFHPAGQGR